MNKKFLTTLCLASLVSVSFASQERLVSPVSKNPINMLASPVAPRISYASNDNFAAIGALYRQKQKEIDELQSNLKLLTTQYSESQESLKQKELDLNTKNKEIETLNNDAKDKKKELEKLVEDHTQELERLKEDKQKLELVTNNFDTQKQTLEKQIQEITKAKTQLENDKSSLEEELKSAKDKSDRLTTELDQALKTNKSFTGYTNAKEALREKLSELSNNYYKKEKELFELILKEGLKDTGSLTLKMPLVTLSNIVKHTVLFNMGEAQKDTEKYKEEHLQRFINVVAEAVQKNENDLYNILKQRSEERVTKFKGGVTFRIEECLRQSIISTYQEIYQENPFKGFDWNWEKMIDNYKALTAHRPASSALNDELNEMDTF